MEPAVGGDQRRQRLDVGRAQLRVDPPLEELVDHRVAPAQLLEHRRVGRVAGLRPLALRQVQLEEQDLLELLGAAEVELVPDVDVDLLLEPGDLRAELAVEDGQRLEVERDARRPPSGRGPGSAAARSRGTAARARPPRGAARAARGRRAPTSASRPARAVAGSSVGGGRIWSRCSATTSAIVWLRSAALRMYAAIWVSNATGGGGGARVVGEARRRGAA